MPDYRFTDPFSERGTTVYGRPGYRDELVRDVPAPLLDLNSLHERYLAPEESLAPVIDAVRAATPAQVEAVRHLMIHALEAVNHALRSRSFSLSRVVYGEGVQETRARTPTRFVGDVASAIHREIEPAMEALMDRPRQAGHARRLAEILRVAHEAGASVAVLAAATDDDALRQVGLSIEADATRAGADLEAFRDDLGRTYAETARAIPDAASLKDDGLGRASRIGSRRYLDRQSTDGLIAALGGAYEDNVARWGFAGRTGSRTHEPGYSDPEPAPLGEAEAIDLRDRFAAVLDAYEDLNHRPGFGGFLNQAMCAFDVNFGGDVADMAVVMGLRPLLSKVGGLDEPNARTLVFSRHAQTSQPGRGDKPREVMVGRLDDAAPDDPALVIYPSEPEAPDGRALLTVLPDADVDAAADEDFRYSRADDGRLLVGGVRPVGGSNFHSMRDVMEHLRRDPFRLVAEVEGPVIVAFDAGPFERRATAPSP